MTGTLLLPGTLCDQALWSDVRWPAGTTVCAPVHGPSLARAAILALAGTSGPVHLVGFSLGAILAFEVLRQFPERVARMTLISANPRPPSQAQLITWDEQERQVRAGRFGTLVKDLTPDGPQGRTVLAMAMRVGPAVFLEQLGLLRSRPDSRETLSQYAGPLTLLVGAHDPVTPPALAEEMRAVAPQALLSVMSTGHYLPLEAPQAVSDALRIPAHA